MGSFLDPLRAVILAINEDSSPPEEVLTAYNAAKAHAAEARELVKLCETAMIDWIGKHGDLIAGPDIRYYVGTERKQRAAEPLSRIADEILSAVGGDMGRFADTLASNPFKFGETRAVLGDKFDALFVTETVSDLKTGKPAETLKKFDKKYAAK